MNKIEKDLEMLKERFKTIDMVQGVLKDKWDLEIYYNDSWAYVEIGYRSEEEINELIRLTKKEYRI